MRKSLYEEREIHMNILKRLGALLAAGTLLLCAGCTNAGSGESAAAPKTEVSIAIPENVLGEASTMLPTLDLDKYAIPEGDAMTFVKNLKIGWNLGNTFDASNANISEANELDYEKAWCGVITTTDNIAAIKAAGFNTIRIPVSWHNHVDADNKISEKWMARVKEVVDWCRACDLYVILNTHHDIDDKGYYPDTANLERSKAFLTSVWTQIAETFKDYDDHLILESLNEPRLMGTSVEWWLDKTKPECVDSANVINQLNQLFVDTVRGVGGENATRWLMCPGYAASADSALYDGFVVPTDAAGHIIVSVHAYTPYNFALNAAGTKDFPLDSPSPKQEITNFMDNLYGKFVSKGIPVVIGEFGARNKDNLQDRVNFAAYYVACARARGITCVWWDNNAFTGSGENFGLLARRDNTFLYPDLVQALMKYAE